MQNQVNQPNQVMQTNQTNQTQPVQQGSFNPLNQWTLKQFMTERGYQKVDVIKNPHTGKLFISFDGIKTAAYSSKLGAGDLSFDLVISQMPDSTIIVHKGGSNQNVQASLSV